jgi:hypothetical protein
MENYKEIWHIVTLVDITETGVYTGNSTARNQQRNFDTLRQVVSLLAQPWSLFNPRLAKWSNLYQKFKQVGIEFGDQHNFTQDILADLNIWTWRFGVEHEGVFDKRKKFDCMLLTDRLDNVPIITGLEENASIDPPVFSTSKQNKNILLICENRI